MVKMREKGEIYSTSTLQSSTLQPTQLHNHQASLQTDFKAHNRKIRNRRDDLTRTLLMGLVVISLSTQLSVVQLGWGSGEHRLIYFIHKLLAHRTDLFAQGSTKHHHLLLVGSHLKDALYISPHI